MNRQFEATKGARANSSIDQMIATFSEDPTYVNTIKRALIAALMIVDSNAIADACCASDSTGKDADAGTIQRFKDHLVKEAE